MDVLNKGFYNSSGDEDLEKLRRSRNRKIAYMAIMPVILLIAVGYSVTVSSIDITALEVYKTLFNQIIPGTFVVDE